MQKNDHTLISLLHKTSSLAYALYAAYFTSLLLLLFILNFEDSPIFHDTAKLPLLFFTFLFEFIFLFSSAFPVSEL